jgi:tetratricopeptide (TPR) repeat protein
MKGTAAALAAVLFSCALPLVASAADKAWTQCMASDPATSIAGCTEVLKRGDKESPQALANAYYNRGNAQSNRGKPKFAVDDYRAAVRLNPDFADAWFNLGNALSSLHDERAISAYDEVVRIDPTYEFAFFNRGNAYADKGSLDLAIADYSSVLKLDPLYANAFFNRGNAYLKKGLFAEALADYEMVLRLDPNNAGARQNRAKAQANLPAAPAPEVASRGGVMPPPESEASSSSRPTGENRVALVIGNSAYEAVPQLPNPKRDAEAVAAALKNDGFTDVVVVENAGRAELVKALNNFADRATNADWAVVYYAGHGMEMNGTNYIIPVDAHLASDRDVQDEAVPLDRVVTAVDSAKKMRLVMLDACRSNPFTANMRKTGATRSLSRGLAQIEPDSGTLVAYAAKAGELAQDGNGENSPFATALIKHLGTPGLEIGKMFRLVRDDVLAATGNQQEPFIYGSLPGEDFYFRPQ